MNVLKFYFPNLVVCVWFVDAKYLIATIKGDSDIMIQRQLSSKRPWPIVKSKQQVPSPPCVMHYVKSQG